MDAKGKIGSFVVDKAMNYISGNPETNMPKLLNWVDSIASSNFDGQSKVLHEVLDNPDSNWYKYIMNLFRDIDNDVLKALFQNLGLRATIIGAPKQDVLAAKLGCNVPFTMLIDPTSACNLKCTGCWAAEYGDKLSMSYETLDSIIAQGKDLGIHFYLYSGGEPLVRKADLIRLCEAHPDCQFAAFTNGTLIDEQFADDLLRVKNFVPIISVEGFEAETDYRRGAGTYKQVLHAMEILKAHRLPFGTSCCYTSKNVDVIGSEEYFTR